MNILFLTLLDFKSFSERNIYCDLLREFIRNNHNVYCISPVERREKVESHFEENGRIYKLKIGNTQKTNIFEKGISILRIESQYVNAIKHAFAGIKFDLVLYSTPPITFAKTVSFVKKRDGAKSYLLLKDIFPQNAVDLGLLKKSGAESLMYRYFRGKEKSMYSISDRIGCMSQANVDYLIKHNPDIDPTRVEVCPNSIEVRDMRISDEEKLAIRNKYELPADKKIFVYGGNFGKPQDIPFLINCLRAGIKNDGVFFLIVGDGTEYDKMETFVRNEKPDNVKILKRLPKEDYDHMIAACDVGMIFLDHRFTIPNFPSRLLSYMQAGLPVFACTDSNTDIGKVITEGGFGWWCLSNDTKNFSELVADIMNSDLSQKSTASFAFLNKHYLSSDAYNTIEKVMHQ